jgi:hypothetical protein
MTKIEQGQASCLTQDKLKIAFAIFLTLFHRTPAASGLTQEENLKNAVHFF